MANLNLLNIFITVAEEKNLTKAAEKLYISQPAISSSIKNLEDELGGELFIRKNKGVELTNEGKVIYDTVKKSLDKIESIYSYFDNVKSINKGILRIGTSTSNINQYLNKTITEFIKNYPDIEIKVIRDSEVNLITKLNENELDLIVLDSEYLAPNLEIVRTFEVTYTIIGNLDYYKKYKKSPIDISSFANENLVLVNNAKTSRQNFDAFFAKYNITLKPKFELENYQLIFDLIRQGLGIGIVNIEYFEKELASKEIYKLPSNFEIDTRSIVLALPAKKYFNPARDVFVKMVQK